MTADPGAPPPEQPQQPPAQTPAQAPKPRRVRSRRAAGGAGLVHTVWPLATIGALALASGNPMQQTVQPPAPQTAQVAPATTGGYHILSGAPPANHMAIHFFDVDQAASALVEFPCGDVLIDAGARDQAGVDTLGKDLETFFQGRPDLHNQINTIFVTHTHIDHNRALESVAEKFDVGGYVFNGRLTGSGKPGANWMKAHAAQAHIPTDEVAETEITGAGFTDNVIDPLSCSDVQPQIHILSGRYDDNPGWEQGDFDNENNQSLVVRIDYGKSSVIFTGDLEAPAIATLLSHYQGTTDLKAEVYVVGHHGSENGTTQPLLQAIQPEVAVMEMGHPDIQAQWTAWAYGHPRRDIVEMLDQAITRTRDDSPTVEVADAVKTFSPYNVRHAVYGTGWDGNIELDADAAGNLRVITNATP